MSKALDDQQSSKMASLPRLNKQSVALCQTFKGEHTPTRLDTSVSPKVVHLGIGAFHRAHQAVFTQDANAAQQTGSKNANEQWRIIGVSLRSNSVAKQLNPQDGLYTVVEKGTSTQLKLINVIDRVLVAPESTDAVLTELSCSNTHVVTLTITEKGYCHDPANGTLNLTHPDIQYDLVNLTRPKTAIGFLVKAIQNRIDQGRAPLSILSCDNLPNNGELLKRVVLAFATQVDPELAQRICDDYSFISTMVDRIVPATSDDDLHEFSTMTGLSDHGLVTTEPFKQWVIEDKFVGHRPAWDLAGALLVEDVHAFETMKLRLLNGSHSSIAYLGYLAGKRYVSDVMQDANLAALIKRIMIQEILPSVDVPSGIQIQKYCEQLLARFNNVHLKHQTYQIAMDGSQKLPQRLVRVIEYHLQTTPNQSEHCKAICLVFAAWCHYVSGIDLQGDPFDVQDPYAETLKEIHIKFTGDARSLVVALLRFEPIFGQVFLNQEVLIDLISEQYQMLQTTKSIPKTINAFCLNTAVNIHKDVCKDE
jgi:fructuronate reductase